MTKRINFFNMIEVALAMAIIAFGMTSILGLFPVGLNASRNSMAENYSADAIEQMSSYMKDFAESSKANYDSLFNSTFSFPTTVNRNSTSIGTPSKSIDGLTGDFMTAFMAGNTTVYSKVSQDWNIYKVPMATVPYVYFVMQGPTGTKNVDYSSMMLIWRSSVSSMVATGSAVNPSSWKQWPEAADDYKYISALNIEISWPLEKKYAEREKRYYYMVVSRPQ